MAILPCGPELSDSWYEYLGRRVSMDTDGNSSFSGVSSPGVITSFISFPVLGSSSLSGISSPEVITSFTSFPVLKKSKMIVDGWLNLATNRQIPTQWCN